MTRPDLDAIRTSPFHSCLFRSAPRFLMSGRNAGFGLALDAQRAHSRF